MGKSQNTSEPPNVAIYSLFRDDGEGYVKSYFERIARLTYTNKRLYLVEGDSEIPTYDYLQKYVTDGIKLTKLDTGIDRFTLSRKHRLMTLSLTANQALDMIAADRWADKILLLESDIDYPPDLIENLINIDGIVAPTIKRDGLFYDLWAFRYKDEKHVSQAPKCDGGLLEMSSVGSVVMYPAEIIYDGVRFAEKAIVGLCQTGRDLGYKVYWNQDVEVQHPERNVSTNL